MNSSIYLLGKETLARSLQRALKTLGIETTMEIPATVDPGWAVILYSTRDPLSFFQAIAETEKICLLGRIIGVCTDPVRSEAPSDRPHLSPECHTLPKIAEDALEKLFETTDLNIEKLNALLTARPAADPSEVRYCHAMILQSAWSYILYNLIYREIAHGTKMDFTNTYLAPVAAGLNLDPTDRGEYFGELRKNLCGDAGACKECRNPCPLKHLHDHLHKGDVRGGLYASEITECVDFLRESPWNYTATGYCETIVKLIEISTRIRRQAGVSPYEVRGTAGLSDKKDLRPVGRGDCSILLIDDHSAYWRPFFSLVAKKLGCRIFFSPDGQNVFTDNGLLDAKSVLPFFDAIVLDIVIGSSWNGFDILKEIRRILPNTPIVIASTTHEPDLAEHLQSVNGFIYKKQLVFDNVTALLSSLLTDGRSGKSHSLPNAFFNSNILGLQRSWTLNFTNWAIKHLDGFHAVDNDYFRYFNDHGGRHMISLLGILEQLVKPFLFPEKDLLGISGANREEQILCLYLAVLCHEFGMFPLITSAGGHSVQIGSNVYMENYNSSDFQKGFADNQKEKGKTINNISQAIRKFHGQRSMFMIMNEGMQYPEFKVIFSKLLACLPENRRKVARCKIAALCGYHNRFLSLKNLDFLQSIGKKEYLLEQIGRNIIGETLNKGKIDCLLREMYEALDSEDRENLRRLCAIFRFADALDIDYSRAIPQYLGYGNRDCKDDIHRNIVENSKRYIVQSVDINFNDIVICFNLNQPIPVQWPSGSHSTEWKSIAGQEYALMIDEVSILDFDDGRLDEIKKEIDAAFEFELKNSKFGVSDLLKLKNMLCVIVMLEVADEYKAIKDVGIQDVLRFGKVKFNTPVVDFNLLEYSSRLLTNG